MLRGNLYAAVAMVGRPWWKVEPLTHIRCMIIASFRATATNAFLLPTRLANFTPQAFSTDRFLLIRRCELAAS